MSVFVMILVGYESKEGRLDGLPFRFQSSSSDTATFQYTNFLSISDKESVIVSPVITVHTLRKQVEIKTLSLNWLNS